MTLESDSIDSPIESSSSTKTFEDFVHPDNFDGHRYFHVLARLASEKPLRKDLGTQALELELHYRDQTRMEFFDLLDTMPEDLQSETMKSFKKAVWNRLSNYHSNEITRISQLRGISVSKMSSELRTEEKRNLQFEKSLNRYIASLSNKIARLKKNRKPRMRTLEILDRTEAYNYTGEHLVH